MYVASFPGLPRFCFLVCVHCCTWKQKSGSSALVYYTESYPKNKDGGGLGTRLYAWSSLAWKPACILLLYIEVMANFISCWIAVIQVTLPVRHIQTVLKPEVTAPFWYQSASSCSRWPANFKRTNCMCHNIQMVCSYTEELTKPLSCQKIGRGLVQGLGLA